MVNYQGILISWYQINKRDLPWRKTKDPYKIWLSEILLQQTRVNQGLPYYLKFVESYPTLKSLSNANEDDVLRLWQGLGYYSRARNMLATAKELENNYRRVLADYQNRAAFVNDAEINIMAALVELMTSCKFIG